MIVEYVDDLQPVVDLKATSLEQIEALRAAPFVSYVEPGSYPAESILHSQCASGPIKHEIRQGTLPEGDKISGAFSLHYVADAWDYSDGSGITIGVIDTGTSTNQPQLNAAFDNGQSSGRTLSHRFTNPNFSGAELWHDGCGHGTKVAGLVAAPRDGQSTVGVAYGANLVTVRATDETAFASQQWSHVRDAIDIAANDAPIVTMSIGSIFHYQGIEDRINYWYNGLPAQTNHNREVIFFGAAGSNFQGIGSGNDGVIFPASLDNVIAVTGLDPDHPDDHGAAENSFRGPKVDFAMHISGVVPYLTPGSETGLGGSSGASPLAAGVAALVWSKYPSWNRQQVIDRLVESSVYHTQSFPRRDDIGHGPISAYQAVGGFSIDTGGPLTVTESGTYTFTADASSLDGGGTYTYDWGMYGTGSSVDISIPLQNENYQFEIFLSATNTQTGFTRQAKHTVYVVAEGCDPTQIECDDGGFGGGGGF